MTPTAQRIYLASASPRRHTLLEQLGMDYEVLVPNVDEARQPGERPRRYVERIARAKAAAGRVMATEPWPVLAADTTVVLDDEALGKPRDDEDACAMLERLSGRRHQVLSAVALEAGGVLAVRLSTSQVDFRPLTGAEIAAYVATGEPRDKAGAYAIQGFAGAFVAHLEGSYSGVMGLPLFETADLLAAVGRD